MNEIQTLVYLCITGTMKPKSTIALIAISPIYATVKNTAFAAANRLVQNGSWDENT